MTCQKILKGDKFVESEDILYLVNNDDEEENIESIPV